MNERSLKPKDLERDKVKQTKAEMGIKRTKSKELALLPHRHFMREWKIWGMSFEGREIPTASDLSS